MPTPPPHVDRFLKKLEGVHPSGKGWKALCPAHKDKEPSLKIDIGKNNDIVVHCHAGCETADILQKINVTWSDMFADRNRKEQTPITTKKRGRFLCAYDYLNEQGELVHQTVRFEEPKGFSQRRPDGRGSWIWSLEGVETILYRLRELTATPLDQWVVVAEGEKDADSLSGLGIPSTTNPLGAGKWKRSYSEALRGRSIVLVADNDHAGREHVQLVARETYGIVARCRIPTLEGLAPGGDISDWLVTHSGEEFEQLVEATPDWSPTESSKEPTEQTTDSGKKPRKSQATLIVELVDNLSAELWHSTNGDAFVSLTVGGHVEHHAIGSSLFNDLIGKLFYDEHRSVPGTQATKDACNVLSGRARYEGEESPVCTRIGWDDGVVWVDLGTNDFSAVRIDAAGWRIVPSSEVDIKFRRNRSMRPLPLPTSGCSLEELRKLFNIDDDAWKLIIAYVLGCYCPRGARAFIELSGQQGSGKTTLLRMIIALTDPSEVDVRAMPKDEESLVVAVLARAMLGIDNLSSLSKEMADALCRLSTGGGIGRRRHYSNDEESLLKAQLPVGWTGINSIMAGHTDLQDRTMAVNLLPIQSDQYQSEADLWDRFFEIQSDLLGAIYSAVSMAILRLPDVSKERTPRMADFARWVEAAAPSFDWEEDDFLNTYEASRNSASTLAVEHSPIGDLIIELIRKDGSFEGPASELLERLRAMADDERKHQRGFPKQANHLSAHLKRIARALAAMGVDVDFEHARASRSITIRKNEAIFDREPKEKPTRTPNHPPSEPAQKPADLFTHIPGTCTHLGCSEPIAAPNRYYCQLHAGKAAA
jgi:energy-coupling factor transporter ATP-binding protein EcfA2